MPDRDPEFQPRYWPLAAGSALLLAAARLGWVLHGLPEMPVYDAWSAIDGIALPLAGGNFDARYLFAPHNEHLLVWTKLLDAIELHLADDQSDARPAGMLVALLGAIAGALLLAGAVRSATRGRGALLVAGIALLGLPYAWENLTEDWGNSYLFLIGGAATTLWIAACGRNAGAAAALLPATLLSVLAMGSGWIAPAFGIAIAVWRVWRADLTLVWATVLIAVQAAAVVLAALLLTGRTQVPAPLPPQPVAMLLQILVAAVAFAPAWLFAARVFGAARSDGVRAAEADRRDTFVAAAGLWGFVHVVAMIVFRPEFRLVLPFSRYMDILAFAALANALCALKLAAVIEHEPLQRLLHSTVRVFAAATLLAAPLPLAFYGWQVERWAQAQALVEAVVRHDDTGALAHAEFAALPHPDRAYLQARLGDPRVHRILGDRVGDRVAPAPFVAASRRIESWIGAAAPVVLPATLLAAAALIAAAFRCVDRGARGKVVAQ